MGRMLCLVGAKKNRSCSQFTDDLRIIINPLIRLFLLPIVREEGGGIYNEPKIFPHTTIVHLGSLSSWKGNFDDDIKGKGPFLYMSIDGGTLDVAPIFRDGLDLIVNTYVVRDEWPWAILGYFDKDEDQYVAWKSMVRVERELELEQVHMMEKETA